MKFVAFFNLKQDLSPTKLAEVISRRAEYKFPEGLELIAEYWTPMRTPAVIAVFEATDSTVLLANSVAWLDAFEIEKVFPVSNWEEGVKKLPKVIARR